ncbi:MAG: hypothetical protein GYB66_02415 [Chloroflexi bacterium]|nr:hypothetical protein [Chloroflexota bacterium]
MATISTTSPAGTGLRVFARLLPVIFLLWIFAFFRWHEIAEHIPYFVDEIHHLRRARAVWTFEDIHTSTTPSKFLTYYWLGLFQLPQYPDLWLVRTPIAMISLLGAAATYALGRILFDQRVAFLALGVVTVFPFILFYERMALTDPLAGALVALVAWWSVVVARRPSMPNATILAVLVILMLAGKLLTGPLIVVPFLAVAFLGRYPLRLDEPLRNEIIRLWHSYKPAIMRAALIIIVVWGIILGIYAIRKIIDPTVRAIIDPYLYEGLSEGSSQLETNIERIQQAFWRLWGPLLIGLSVLGLPFLIRWRWRTAAYLLGAMFALWIFVLLVAGQLNSRYLTLVVEISAVLISGGVVVAYDDVKLRGFFRGIAIVPVILLLVWIVGYGLPFAITATRDPLELNLPDRDRSEYFRNYTGYALPDGLEFVADSPPISAEVNEPVLIVFVRLCEHLPYHMPEEMHDEIQVECPPDELGTFDQRYVFLNQELAIYGPVYLMVEQYRTPDGSPIVEASQVNGELALLATFERPFDGVAVEVYSVYPATEQVGGGDEP